MPDEAPGLDEVLQDLAAQEQGTPIPEVSEAEPVATDAVVAEGVDTVKPPEEPEAPPVAEGQPRDEKGRFLPKEEAGKPDPDQIEGEDVDDGLEWEEVAINLPTGEKVPVEVSPELAAHINELAEQAATAEAAQQEALAARETYEEANQRQAELDEIQAYIEQDPVGYLTSRVRPELRKDVVMDLLLMDDTIYEEVSEQLGKWQYEPAERRIQSAEQRAKRAEQAVAFRQQQARRSEIQQRAAVLTASIRGFVPTEMPAGTAQRFAEDMHRDLSDYARQNGWDGVTPEVLPKILAYRLDQYGVDPNTMTNGAPRDASGVVIAHPANEEAKAIAEAREAGQKLRRQYQRRRVAGASAPTGVGTPANRARPPKGATLNEALDWAKTSSGGA